MTNWLLNVNLDVAGPVAFFAGCLFLLIAVLLVARRPKRRWLRVGRFLPAAVFLVAGVMATSGGGYLLWFMHRAMGVAEKKTLFTGITYERVIFSTPRPMVMSILTVDMQAPGISVLVTPPKPTAGGDIPARTTREFLRESGGQVAINANPFGPFIVHSPLDYYPHSGDPVTPASFAASRGVRYGKAVETLPTFNISADNQTSYLSVADCDAPDNPPRYYNAISGTGFLVIDGKPSTVGPSSLGAHTAIGRDKTGRYLYLIVVDGKQPHYSEGISLQELADRLPIVIPGIDSAIYLDGGGSSTMAAQDAGGEAVLLNAPINMGVVGWERPVANQLVVFARR